LDRFRRGADENQLSPFDLLGKFGVLRQEAIAGVDRVGARDRSLDDCSFVQIGFCRVCGADFDRFIGEPDRQHLFVRGAHRLNSLDPERPSRADDPRCDLAPIGDKNFQDRHRRLDLEVVDGLAGHHRILVLNVECDDLSVFLGDHWAEGLHHLDEPDCVAYGDCVALLFEGRLIAPGADRIGNHLDGECRFNARSGLDVIQGGGGASVNATNCAFQNLAHVMLHSVL
jgi:hypothetical protein